MENNDIKCPACLSVDIQGLVDKKLVTFIFPVPKSTISKVNREKIRIFICNSCSHVFQVNVNEILINHIYADFYDHYNLDTSIEFQKIYRDRTIEFIDDNLNDNNSNNLNILDIGCGEGTYFPFFSNHGYGCYGFEPSNKNIIAKKKNPNAIISSSYFENHSDNIFNVNFNIILLNWVLEHVLSIDNFFLTLKAYCNIGTRIVFQVPDLLYYVENDLYLFYVHEHIHYFTPFSIQQCLGRFGFKLIKYKNGDCPSLLICAEYSGKKKINNFKNDIEQSRSSIIEFVNRGNELVEDAKKVFYGYDEIYFYGVGTSTYWLGEYVLNDEIKKKVKVIDDNEFYFDKIVPSFHCTITKIEEVIQINKGVFFIGTSPVYRKNIVNKILKNVSGKYDIVFIEDNNFQVISNTLIQ